MLSRMNFAHLKYFLDAAELLSVTKAAERNNVSQSAVSQAISNLERLTKQKLLRHHRNKFILSSDGQLLVDKLIPIFHQLREIDEFFCSTSSHPQGEIEISCPRSIALSLLIPHLQALKCRFPKITPRLRMFTPDLVRERLLKSEVELAILIDNVDLSLFETRLLHQGHFRLFRHKKKPHLETNRAIFTENRREVIQFKRSYEQTFGHPISVYMEASSWDVIARYTQQGFACGFLPDYVGESYPDLEPIELPLPPLAYKVYLAFKSENHLSRTARVTLDCICDRTVPKITSLSA